MARKELIEMETVKPQSWLVRHVAGTRRIRLYCFCYAGGSASSFLPWQAFLNSDVELCVVQLPGRGSSFAELPYTSTHELIKVLAPIIAEQNRVPFAFFGHSLGGLLAFEVARYLMLHSFPLPSHVFVSACAAPRRRDPPKNLHRLSDADLINALCEYNGTPKEVLQNAELMQFVLPAIRADFALVDSYEYRVMPMLDIPIMVLAGKSDATVSKEQAGAWAMETSGPCHIHWFEGDHFFIHSEQQGVIRCVNTALANTGIESPQV